MANPNEGVSLRVGVDRDNPVAMDTYGLDVFIHHIVLPHPEPRTRFGILFRCA